MAAIYWLGGSSLMSMLSDHSQQSEIRHLVKHFKVGLTLLSQLGARKKMMAFKGLLLGLKCRINQIRYLLIREENRCAKPFLHSYIGKELRVRC